MAKTFLSTLSLRRATTSPRRRPPQLCNFYPRSPCGERQQVTFWQDIDDRISIHALLAESDIRAYQRHFPPDISIHALLAESDERSLATLIAFSISIHALLAESDPGIIFIIFDCWIFLSTLSLRRATTYPSQCRTLARDFYPRSPCGERLFTLLGTPDTWAISIHALLAESDLAHLAVRP